MRHPLTGAVAHTFRVRAGGVATSGIDARLWERDGGDFAHHLIDPATGTPAWTGLIAATALAPTALEAEALAKAALLSGPAAGAAAAAGPLRRRARPRRRRRRPGHLKPDQSAAGSLARPPRSGELRSDASSMTLFTEPIRTARSML